MTDPVNPPPPPAQTSAWGFLALTAVAFNAMVSTAATEGVKYASLALQGLAQQRAARPNPTDDFSRRVEAMQREPQIHILYRRWLNADDAFGEALRRAYGRRAGDMRFAKSWPGHPEIEAAWRRSSRTGHAYIAALKASR